MSSMKSARTKKTAAAKAAIVQRFQSAADEIVFSAFSGLESPGASGTSYLRRVA